MKQGGAAAQRSRRLRLKNNLHRGPCRRMISLMQSAPANLLKSLVYVDWQRRKRMLRREAWATIVLAYLAIVTAWVFPGSFDTSSRLSVLWTWAMMLVRVLYFQIGLVLLCIAMLALVWRNYRMAVCPVPLVLLTVLWPCLNVGGAPVTNRGPVLRVISANLLMVNRNTEPILAEIEAASADVVFLQEYTEHGDEAFSARLGAIYPHRIIFPQEDSFGAAIYSRHPFVGEPRRDNSLGKWLITQLSAQIQVGGHTVDCRNIHLVPPRTLSYTTEHFDEMRDFADTLSQDRDTLVIIAGDFNFTGSTLQARAIEASGFHDAFIEAGAGRGSTWPVNGIFRYLPGIRLDHIFLSPALSCRFIQTGQGQGSDHRPLIAEIELPPSE